MTATKTINPGVSREPFLCVRKNEAGGFDLMVDELAFEFSNDGCQKAGRMMADAGITSWMCSSDLDFPGDFSNEVSDAHAMIHDGYNNR